MAKRWDFKKKAQPFLIQEKRTTHLYCQRVDLIKWNDLCLFRFECFILLSKDQNKYSN